MNINWHILCRKLWVGLVLGSIHIRLTKKLLLEFCIQKITTPLFRSSTNFLPLRHNRIFSLNKDWFKGRKFFNKRKTLIYCLCIYLNEHVQRFFEYQHPWLCQTIWCPLVSFNYRKKFEESFEKWLPFFKYVLPLFRIVQHMLRSL